MESTNQQIKVCVIGGGFTGILTALSLKIHCPNHQVMLIDSNQEPRNLGFGESGPPDLLNSLIRALKIPESQQTQWIADWLKETHSVIKYNFKWKNFLSQEDSGYYSGLPNMPSYLAIIDPSHTGNGLRDSIVNPDHNEYMLYDLWYELYLAGRRQLADFEPDINSFYHHCEQHTMPSWQDQIVSSLGSLHINSYEVCQWLKSKYSHLLDAIVVDTVKHIARNETGAIDALHMISGQSITADFYIDCTGFKRLMGREFNLHFQTPSTTILHDSVLIVANGYTNNIDREMHPYTLGYGMDYGWTFSVPLLDRKSYGYNYHRDFINADQALLELETLSDPKTRVVDPVELTWQPGGYSQSWQHNFALLGLSSVFVDPFDANTIALQFRQIFTIIKWLQTQDPFVRKTYNYFTSSFIESVAERVELHQGLAPRNTSEYWKRNKEVAQKKHLQDLVFEVMKHPSHSSKARSDNQTFLPYLSHLYLTEIVYYGIDMSRRCRKSDPALLDLAEQYFKFTNSLNCARAKTSTTMRDWYQTQGIDIDQYIRFKK